MNWIEEISQGLAVVRGPGQTSRDVRQYNTIQYNLSQSQASQYTVINKGKYKNTIISAFSDIGTNKTPHNFFSSGKNPNFAFTETVITRAISPLK